MTNHWAERIFICVSAIAVVGFLVLALRVPKVPYEALGPSAFPLMVGGLGLVGVVLMAFERWNATEKDMELESIKEPVHLKSLALLAVVTLLYFIGLEPLGFVVSTTAFLLVMLSFLNRGRWVANVLSALLISGGIYLLLHSLLKLELPRGILGIG